MTKTCETCGGSGKFSVECDRCSGIPHTRFEGPEGHYPCSKCGGSGGFSGKCGVCYGDGYIE